MIKDDIQAMEAEQERQFKDIGRYVQVLPGIIKPDDEDVPVTFNQTELDYDIRVDVWTRKHLDNPLEQGFRVTAVKDLGDGITETITSRDMENG